MELSALRPQCLAAKRISSMLFGNRLYKDFVPNGKQDMYTLARHHGSIHSSIHPPFVLQVDGDEIGHVAP